MLLALALRGACVDGLRLVVTRVVTVSRLQRTGFRLSLCVWLPQGKRIAETAGDKMDLRLSPCSSSVYPHFSVP